MLGLLRFLFSGLMFKLLLVAGIIFGLYYFNIWPFNKNVADLDFLKEKYCSESALANPENAAICDCIVKKAEADIKKRFTEKQLDSIKKDKLKMAYVLQKSMEKLKTRSQICLEDRQQPQAMKKFTTDLATLDNEVLGKVGGLLNSGVDLLKEKWKNRESEKEAIDEKYK